MDAKTAYVVAVMVAAVAALVVAAPGDEAFEPFDGLWAAASPVAARQLAAAPLPPAFPTYTSQTTGAWDTADAKNWNAGYLTGCHWKMYALTRDAKWRALALKGLKGLAGIAGRTDKKKPSSNAAGIAMASFGEALRWDDKATAADKAKYASELAKVADAYVAGDWNAKVGALRSWKSKGDAATTFTVIIDSSVGTALLWLTPKHADKATSHLRAAARNHVRPDGSTFHVVEYDSRTGRVAKRRTHQGASDSSTWARGQAWAVYGLATAYEATKDADFLRAARKTADYFVKAVKAAGYVPPWDFAAPADKPWKDTSAAAIGAAGLLILADCAGDPTGKPYADAAVNILKALVAKHLSPGMSPASILANGTYNAPDGHHDTGMIVGDYYFLEALQRLSARTGTGGQRACVPSPPFVAK